MHVYFDKMRVYYDVASLNIGIRASPGRIASAKTRISKLHGLYSWKK
jgi:hypothetical protein